MVLQVFIYLKHLMHLKHLQPLQLFIIFAAFNASLAQLVEQLIRNEQVVGSSPIGGSKVQFCELMGIYIIF
jgi:hypothetical protein